MPAPPRETGTQTTTTVDTTDYIEGLHRRRASSYRLPVLDSGRADPWHYDRVQPSEKMVDAYRDAALTLSAAGLTPAALLPEMRALWRRGGTDRNLVRDIATRWGVAA